MKISNKSAKNYFRTDVSTLNLRAKALRGASATIIAQVLNFIITMTGTMILARLLSPDDFGLIAMVLIFSLLLQNFGFNGFTELIIQRREINHQQISTLFWINFCINLCLSLAFIAFSPIIAWFYDEPRLIKIITLIAASILFSGLSTQHLALLQRNMQFHRTSVNSVVASFTSVLIAILLASNGWGYWALAMKWVLLPLMTTLGAWILCRWRPGLPSRNVKIWPMIKFALNTYGNFVIDYFGRNIDKLLLGKFYGTHPLGYYDRAYQLSNMLPNQLVHPMSNIAVAALSRVTDNPEKYHKSYLEVISLLAFISMPLSAILTITGSDLVLLLLGPQWNTAGKLFQIFGISLGIKMIYSTHGWLHLSLGKPDRWLRWSIIALIVTVFCFLIGINFGLVGMTIAYSVSFYFLIGPGLWYAGKPIQLGFLKIISTIWRYCLSAFLSGLTCHVVLHSLHSTSAIFQSLHVLYRIFIASLLVLSLYSLLTIAIFNSTKPIKQFFLVLKEMLPNISFAKYRGK